MSTPTSKANEDAMRDEHLRAALRHAPDRDLRPSASVSAQILASAHRAAGEAGGGATTSSWARWRERLAGVANALRQPGPAAAFASVMLATVIGVMWRDGPPPEGPRDRVAGGSFDLSASAPVRPASDRASASERVVEAAAPTASVAQRSASEASADRARKAAPKPAPPPAAPKAAAVAPPEEPATAAAPAAPAPRLDPAFERRAREPAQSMATAPSEPVNTARLSSRSQPVAGAAAARSEAVTADAASASVDPLGPLATAWAASPGDRADAVGELRRLTQGRWALVPADDAVLLMSASAATPGPDGASLGRLLIVDNAVLWQANGTGSATWRAPLPAAAAATLRERLAPEARPQR